MAWNLSAIHVPAFLPKLAKEARLFLPIRVKTQTKGTKK
jgi:hypothetical protein